MRIFLTVGAAIIAIVAGVSFLWATTITSVTSTPPLTDAYSSRFAGKNMLLLSSNEIVDDVLRHYPRLDTVTVTKQFPAALVIRTTLSKPFAQLTASNSAIILSSKAKVLSLSDNETLPRIYYYGDIPAYMRRIGSVINLKEITYAISLITQLNAYRVKPQTVRITSPKTIELELKSPLKTNAPTYLLTTQKNIDKNSQLVHNIQEMLKREGIGVSRVDMRYDKPILIK